MQPKMEDIFSAWQAWDLASDPAAKVQMRIVLNAAIDAYKAAHGLQCSRALLMFFAREDYAKWRTNHRP